MKRLMTLLFTLTAVAYANPSPEHYLRFDNLAVRWDEAVPLGNGMVGALIWQEGDTLRFSLDRSDLWDDRPVENFQKPEFRFDWMLEQVNKGDIESVQELIDKPYRMEPAPTKIPAGRLEFDQSGFGKAARVELDINKAVCTVEWESGVRLETFVHATEPIGWFRLSNVKKPVRPSLAPPPFGGETGDLSNVNSLNTPPLSSTASGRAGCSSSSPIRSPRACSAAR